MSYAVDLFERQELNVDRSGCGSLEIFKRNLADFDEHAGANVEIIAGDSLDPALDLRSRVREGSVRFLSVDGGHTVEHVMNDLAIARDLIANAGVVIVDDMFNVRWPSVAEGVNLWLSQRPTLVPFAIGRNKLLMCKFSFQQAYFDHMRQHGFEDTCTRLHGFPLVVL